MMYTTFAHDKSDFNALADLGFTKLLLEVPQYSLLCRLPDQKLDYSRLEYALNQCGKGLELVLLVDVLCHNRDLKEIHEFLLRSSAVGFRKVRVQDIGLAWYIKTHFAEFQLELNTVTGNYTRQAFAFFEKTLAPALTTMVLNKEIVVNDVGFLVASTELKTEVQAHGPIQVFYTRRPLLSEHKLSGPFAQDQQSEVFITEKSESRSYRFYENQHGTFMFHFAGLSLLGEIHELLACGVSGLLFDFRDQSFACVKDVMELYHRRIRNAPHPDEQSILDHYYPKGVTQGFFYQNTTDARVQINTSQKHCVAKVLSILKGQRIILESYDSLKAGETLCIKTPTDKELLFTLEDIQDVLGRQLTEVLEGQIVSLPWKKNVVPESSVYKTES